MGKLFDFWTVHVKWIENHFLHDASFEKYNETLLQTQKGGFFLKLVLGDIYLHKENICRQMHKYNAYSYSRELLILKR